MSEMVKLLDKVRDLSGSIPGMMIDITTGLAGMFLPGNNGFSSFDALLAGDMKGAFGAAAYNYGGININGRGNTLGSMFRRARGTWAAVLGQVLKSIYNEVK